MAKGQALYVVIALVITSILLFSAWSIFADVFNLSTRTTNSFSNIVEALENLKQDGDQDPVAFFFD